MGVRVLCVSQCAGYLRLVPERHTCWKLAPSQTVLGGGRAFWGDQVESDWALRNCGLMPVSQDKVITTAMVMVRKRRVPLVPLCFLVSFTHIRSVSFFLALLPRCHPPICNINYRVFSRSQTAEAITPPGTFNLQNCGHNNFLLQNYFVLATDNWLRQNF